MTSLVSDVEQLLPLSSTGNADSPQACSWATLVAAAA
jgi:hypothetical protein